VLVRIRLTPARNTFYEMFATSGKNLVVGASLLKDLLGADAAGRSVIAEKMRAAEHAGDEATHAIMRELNETFVTPFDREDIYRLASSLDDVMDAMEAAVDLVVLYKIGELPAEVADQVDVLERAAALTAEAMPRLRSMKDLSEFWIELNRLENQADHIYRRLLARLFSGEYDTLTVLKLKEVVDQLEEAADAFEHVANTVETIAVKES
jgi:predicted phosphate transport protein (TIGR00153 family)